jgi:hypothetical protein
MRVKTKDLYCAAFLASQGGALDDVILTPDGRRGRLASVTFIFSGDNMEQLTREFLNGQATVNLATFKLAMHEMKERMFDVMNER